MQVAEAMTRDVHMVNPDQSIIEASKMMADCDCGALPVSENDRLIGMITDRDIVIRGLANGKDGNTKIKDVMSKELKYCFEEEDVDEVALNMGELQMRRLPVVNKEKRLIGIVSLGDIACNHQTPSVVKALTCISESSAQHAQHMHTS